MTRFRTAAACLLLLSSSSRAAGLREAPQRSAPAEAPAGPALEAPPSLAAPAIGSASGSDQPAAITDPNCVSVNSTVGGHSEIDGNAIGPAAPKPPAEGWLQGAKRWAAALTDPRLREQRSLARAAAPLFAEIFDGARARGAGLPAERQARRERDMKDTEAFLGGLARGAHASWTLNAARYRLRSATSELVEEHARRDAASARTAAALSDLLSGEPAPRLARLEERRKTDGMTAAEKRERWRYKGRFLARGAAALGVLGALVSYQLAHVGLIGASHAWVAAAGAIAAGLTAAAAIAARHGGGDDAAPPQGPRPAVARAASSSSRAQPAADADDFNARGAYEWVREQRRLLPAQRNELLARAFILGAAGLSLLSLPGSLPLSAVVVALALAATAANAKPAILPLFLAGLVLTALKTAAMLPLAALAGVALALIPGKRRPLASAILLLAGLNLALFHVALPPLAVAGLALAAAAAVAAAFEWRRRTLDTLAPWLLSQLSVAEQKEVEPAGVPAASATAPAAVLAARVLPELREVFARLRADDPGADAAEMERLERLLAETAADPSARWSENALAHHLRASSEPLLARYEKTLDRLGWLDRSRRRRALAALRRALEKKRPRD